MGQRAERVESQLKKIISEIVQKELKDPRIGFVTITGVDVSGDLQHAIVFFSVLGDKQQHEDTTKGLNSSAGYIRMLVGKKIKMRYTPQITFLFDESTEYSSRIDEIINKIHKEKENEPR